MIKSIIIEHFFSFGESQKITLNSETNILIGINGSGKSNFIKSIELLCEGIAGGGMANLVNKKWGGFSALANCNTSLNAETISITYEFDKEIIEKVVLNGNKFSQNPIYEIKISKLGNYYSLAEYLYSVNPESPDKPFTYLKVKNGKGVLSARENRQIKLKPATFQEDELVLKQLFEPQQYFPLFTLQKAIKRIFVYNYFDTTWNSKIRGLSPYYTESQLLPSGENLTHLLNLLSGNYTESYDKILSALKDVNPHFRDLVFTQPTGSETLLTLKEKFLSHAITVKHISDGTLRFLILLSILYNPNRGKIVCLDEPEIGLHPDMINTVAEGIKYAAQNGTQMIVATHSPLLLNSFDLEDLLIFEKNEQNKTIVSTKSEDDLEWGNEFSTGRIWLNGLIGGKRW